MSCKAIIKYYNNPEFYLGEDIVFYLHRKLLLKNRCQLIDSKGKEILAFTYTSIHCFQNLKIIRQCLDKNISVKNKKRNDRITVDGNTLIIKRKFKLYGKLEAKCIFNDETVGEVIEVTSYKSKKYELKFYSQTEEYKYYFLILFAIFSVGFSDVLVL